MTKCEIFPIGTVPSDSVTVAGDALTPRYNLQPVKKPPIALPKQAFEPSRNQYNATMLVKYVKRKKRAEYALGLINEDLYSKGLNFVFGQAIPRSSAILSLYRLQSENEGQFKDRIEKEILHEVGHVLGLSHCTTSTCVMRFSNSLRQVDQKGGRLCPKCQEKLASLREKKHR